MASNANADNIPPPELDSIYVIYPTAVDAEGNSHKDRYEKIRSAFVNLYGTEPSFYARAPGRVNLIGEHVDYSGFGVLPMAIEKDVIIAVSVDPKATTLEIANLDPKYTALSSPADPAAVVFQRNPTHWTNYFLAGYKETAERVKAQPVGLKLLVHGNVPPGSGLSSSSGLVCASALATVTALKGDLTRAELASLCAVCERYVGAESGGMDQAISYLAEAGRAKKIDFDPLRSADVHLPSNAAFVVVDSLVQHSLQSQIAGASYNIRVVECRLASVVLAKQLGLEWSKVRRLIDVKKLSGLSFDDLLAKVEEILHTQPYTKDEIASLIGLEVSDLVKNYVGTVQIEHLELYKRAKHVFSESQRVFSFYELCQKDDESIIKELGSLMNDSHTSCRDLFNCSCDELEHVVSLCRNAGAAGARLTGAGWGGWAIALVPRNELGSFLEKMKNSHQGAFFSTLPCRGACVLKLSS
eukprot:TRINITY_DN6047_c0_g1_i1.p1 TRINITY_DN6047_c0_g1~~TRINITY_DN6047_c0_g1_i1.p1  ORF type:complete len:490 (-),score=102.02 TRINITY_DN6047_c0_g1_i1:94-1503(-)